MVQRHKIACARQHTSHQRLASGCDSRVALQVHPSRESHIQVPVQGFQANAGCVLSTLQQSVVKQLVPPVCLHAESVAPTSSGFLNVHKLFSFARKNGLVVARDAHCTRHTCASDAVRCSCCKSYATVLNQMQRCLLITRQYF
jgi:hypothetical protein